LSRGEQVTSKWQHRIVVGLVLVFPPLARSADVIVTIAGNGEAQDAGDSADIASSTSIGQPFGVEIGSGGSLVVCEVQNHRVRRIDLETGKVTTLAGSGQKGYAGDGGPATKARLDEPYEVRFDQSGRMYFVEMQNHVVRRVAPSTGIISTVAGDGQPGYSGDGGPATSARLNQPHSIALDNNGGLLIADIGNHRIRRVDLTTGRIESIAGNGEKSLPKSGELAKDRPMLGPRALSVRGDTLWIALREGHSVWTMDLKSGKLSHIAGIGKPGFQKDPCEASAAAFNGPKGIAVAPDGTVLVVDSENQAIRRIDPARSIVTTIAGMGPEARGFRGDEGAATSAWLNRPHGICVAGEMIFIGDSENHRVRMIRP
jgi:streptogramin lyase